MIGSNEFSSNSDYDGTEDVLESATSISDRKERGENDFAVRLSQRHLVRQQTTKAYKLDPLW